MHIGRYMCGEEVAEWTVALSFVIPSNFEMRTRRAPELQHHSFCCSICTLNILSAASNARGEFGTVQSHA